MSYRLIMDDARVAGYCASGIRAFARRHDLDLAKLVSEGWTEEDVGHIEDEHLNRAIKIAEERTARNGG